MDREPAVTMIIQHIQHSLPNILNILCKQTASYINFETTYDPPDDQPYSNAIPEVCEIEMYGTHCSL